MPQWALLQLSSRRMAPLWLWEHSLSPLVPCDLRPCPATWTNGFVTICSLSLAALTTPCQAPILSMRELLLLALLCVIFSLTVATLVVLFRTIWLSG